MKKTILYDKRPENLEPKPFNMSVSKVKTFDSCPAKYRYAYIERLPKKDRDYHIFGKFLHRTLELYHIKILEGATENSAKIMTIAYREALVEYSEKLTQEQIVNAKEIISHYLQQNAVLKRENKLPTVLKVEEEFYIDVDGLILINGFIDRVQLDHDGVLHVTDYKTSKSDKYLKKDYFQLLTYAYVKCLQDPNLQKVRTSYMMLRQQCESLVKEFPRDEIMKIENYFLEYLEKIKEEKLFRGKVTPLCDYCDYQDICEFYKAKSGNKINMNNEW